MTPSKIGLTVILAYSTGLVFGARVHIFVLGRHLEFSNCGGLGRRNICRGSRRELEIWARREGKVKTISSAPPLPYPPPASAPTLHRSSIQLQSKMAALIGNLILLLLSNVPLQNNACTAVCRLRLS